MFRIKQYIIIFIFILLNQLSYSNEYINNELGFSFIIPYNIIFDYSKGYITKEFKKNNNKKFLIYFYFQNINEAYELIDPKMTQEKLLEYYEKDKLEKFGQIKPYTYITYNGKRIGLYALGRLFDPIAPIDIYASGMGLVRYNIKISISIWYYDINYDIPKSLPKYYSKSKDFTGEIYLINGLQAEAELRNKIVNNDKDAPEELVKLFTYIESIAKSLKFWDVIYKVKDDNDYLFSNNNSSDKHIRKLVKGERLRLVERIINNTKQDDNVTWIKVKTEKGEIGWCKEENMELQIDKEHERYYETTVDNLRLRDKASINSKIIRELKIKEKLILIEKGNAEIIKGILGSWIKVRTEQGETGWCFGGYLEEVK